MGLFINQNDNRSQLQERLVAELREKAKRQHQTAEPLDQTTKSNYIKNTEEASKFSWLWLIVVAVLMIAVGIYLTLR